ncbi:dihydrofolate reductase [Siminovitchia sp. 179-K 8D1 HS]|uniref:dihydrofolate reductase n=1 Tax=Siminovitchia sp. 179-K 8D1 HS TaxID=3142385 RepID=UPI0039A3ECE4
MSIKIIACFDRSRAIGYKNKLLYKLPNDLKRFKELTTGHFVLFGRKTFQSVLKYNNGNPLSKRESIVLTKNENFEAPLGVHVFNNIESIINHYTKTGNQDRDLWICGGEQIYRQAMPYADEIYATLVDTVAPKADSMFPVIDEKHWELVDSITNKADEKHKYDYVYLTYRRR